MKTNIAEKFRKMADGCQAKIDSCLAHRETNTAKRLAQAMHARLDGRHWERTQAMLRALADHYEAGTVPPALAEVKSKAEVHSLAAAMTEPVQNGYHTYRVEGNGPALKTPQALAAWELLTPKSAEQVKADQLAVKLGQLKNSQIPGFFPTPQELVRMMLTYVNLSTETPVILDPNGGSGAILDEARARWPRADLESWEIHYGLYEILQLKGYSAVRGDFMLSVPEPVADLVLMNPPFENLQDCDHIRHAYQFLKPGGQLIAIMSPSAFSRTNSRKAEAFVEWFNFAQGSIVERIEPGAFKSSGTMVATVMVKIVKSSGGV